MEENKDSEELQMYQNNEIDLINILSRLWEKRIYIIIPSLLVALFILSISTFIYLTQTKNKIATLNFSLNFNGFSKGEYPNGLRFTPNDITSPVILKKVYNTNSLDKYFKDFSNFQNSITIYKNSYKLLPLNAEYSSKLNNNKLTAPEREKIESNYQTARNDILSNTEYNLVFYKSFTLAKPPNSLSSKILNDILRYWIDYAVKTKGINKYRISIITENIISDYQISDLNYIIKTDLLRTSITNVIANIESITKIPGADTTYITNNNNSRINIRDLIFRADFLQNYELQPLVGAINIYGISKTGPLSTVYLQTKMMELERNKKVLVNQKEVYSSALLNYIGIRQNNLNSSNKIKNDVYPQATTQLDGTFLDKIVNMIQEDGSQKYKQTLTDKVISTGLDITRVDKNISYYTDLMYSFSTKESQFKSNLPLPETNKEKKEVLKLVAEKLKTTQERLKELLHDVNLFYDKLSDNLYPQTEFFKANSFTVSVEKSISLKKLLMISMLIWMLLEIIIISIALISDNIKKTRSNDKDLQDCSKNGTMT